MSKDSTLSQLDFVALTRRSCFRAMLLPTCSHGPIRNTIRLAVSDAQIVARLVDGAILVVRPEKNHRRLVARACDAFRSTGSQVLGVVANDVSDFAGGGYGYGYQYTYSYGHGDEAESTDHDDTLHARAA